MALAAERSGFLEFGVDLLLNGDGDSREQGRIPVKFGHELAHHFPDADDVPAAGLDVDLFFVIEIRLEPEEGKKAKKWRYERILSFSLSRWDVDLRIIIGRIISKVRPFHLLV